MVMNVELFSPSWSILCHDSAIVMNIFNSDTSSVNLTVKVLSVFSRILAIFPKYFSIEKKN